MAFPKAGTMSRKTKSNIPATKSRSLQSTNVSSPPLQQQRTNQGRTHDEITQQTETQSRHFTGHTDEDEDEDQPDSLGFMPVRQGGTIRKRPVKRGEQGKRGAGKPITEDPELFGKSPYELDLVDRFTTEAKILREKIMNEQGWNRIDSAFTDKTLRTLGLRLPTSKLVLILPIFFLPVTNNDLKTAENELIAITGLNAEKFQKLGPRFLELLRKFEKEYRKNMEGVDVSQLQSQYPSQSPINVTDDDEDEENFINSDDDEDYVETGERSEYFASDSANFQPPVMSQAQRALMEQVAGANRTGGGGSSSKAASGARVKKGYGTGPKRGARKGVASGSGTRNKPSGGKRFSAGSANSQGGPSRGGRSAGGRGARGGGRGATASVIRPMA